MKVPFLLFVVVVSCLHRCCWCVGDTKLSRHILYTSQFIRSCNLIDLGINNNNRDQNGVCVCWHRNTEITMRKCYYFSTCCCLPIATMTTQFGIRKLYDWLHSFVVDQSATTIHVRLLIILFPSHHATAMHFYAVDQQQSSSRRLRITNDSGDNAIQYDSS